MVVSERRMTLEEFLALPERKPALEFEDGVVTQKVSPRARHSRTQVALARLIGDLLEPDKIAMVFTEVRVTFGRRSRVPDVVVYAWVSTITWKSSESIRENSPVDHDVDGPAVGPLWKTPALRLSLSR